jgi:hypothetical protein
VKSRRLNTKSANVLENPLKKIYYYEITKLMGMGFHIGGPYWGFILGPYCGSILWVHIFAVFLQQINGPLKIAKIGLKFP